MTTPTPSPDVRELAKAAAAAVRQRALSVWGGSWITLYSDEEIADAVLAAVSPAIRAEERAKIAEELRTTVADQASWLWFELGESALLRVARFIEESPAAAIARSHAHPEEGK